MNRSSIRVLLLMTVALLARAATTATWEMNTYEDFLKGRFSGVSLNRDGRLELAPRLDTVFSSDQPAIWSVAEGSDGAFYLGTGHTGRVYRVGPDGKAEVMWTADEPEVFAVAIDSKGVLFAATSPEGKVYRFENGKAAEYFAPDATYIWSLALAKDGALFVGVGDDGKIYRVTGPGKGEVYYDTGQSHVTCLVLDSEGRLLAGTEPNGILYRITGKERGFVLHDAPHPEIRGILPMADGTVYAASLGGSVSRQAAAAAALPAGTAGEAAKPVTITVTAAESDVEIKPKPETEKPVPSPPSGVIAPVGLEIAGAEKSSVWKIHPDNTVETLWTSMDENVYDLIPSGDSILFSTDARGRIYELGPDLKTTLLAQTNESEAIRLLRRGKDLVIATGNMGKLFRLAQEQNSTGSYEAPAHDAGNVARWGRLSWRAGPASAGKVEFQTRSGNSARPDKTWSEWSAPLTDPQGSSVQSPNARFVQWRASFAASSGKTPSIDAVTLAYLPQNTPPKVASISAVTKSAPSPEPKTAQSTASSSTYSVTVTDTGEPGASTTTGTSTQRLSRAGSERIEINWEGEDSDGDELVYSLYFRGDGEREWKLLKADLDQATHTIDSNSLADGRYFFRVTASDRLANPPSTARQTEAVSAPVLIDQTPPVVSLGPPRRSGGSAEVDVDARDAASPLLRCEYSLDAGRWTPVAPEDAITDSVQERFHVQLKGLTPGEHLLVVRAFDAAGNAGLARTLIE